MRHPMLLGETGPPCNTRIFTTILGLRRGPSLNFVSFLPVAGIPDLNVPPRDWEGTSWTEFVTATVVCSASCSATYCNRRAARSASLGPASFRNLERGGRGQPAGPHRVILHCGGTAQ